jgi:hypothetical protein
VRENHEIDLTPSEYARVEQYAREHAISVEAAATELAQRAIEARYVLPKNRSNVVPMRGLKRGRSNV